MPAWLIILITFLGALTLGCIIAFILCFGEDIDKLIEDDK